MPVRKFFLSILLLLFIAGIALPGLLPVPSEAVGTWRAPRSDETDQFAPAVLLDSPHYPSEPDVVGESLLLYDILSGEILFERNAHAPWPPASLTKLFTIYTVLDAVEAGEFSLSRAYDVPAGSYASDMEPGSSLMFLGPGQKVTGEDLLYGLSVSSGNDAAYATALLVAGGVTSFMREVAEDVERMGLLSTSLVEPSGISAANVTTARDLGRLARTMVLRWPDETRTYLAQREFSYPRSENLGASPMPTITQQNRNTLLWNYRGADGMKTGFIDESGYNLVATAERDGRRLIAVVLGITANSHAEGGAARSRAAAALLDWGFENFEVIRLASPNDRYVRVLGSNESVSVRAEREPVAVLPPESAGELRGIVTVQPALWAPVEPGTPVGEARYLVDGEEIASVALVAGEAVARGGAWAFFRDRYRSRLELLLYDRRGETALAQ